MDLKEKMQGTPVDNTTAPQEGTHHSAWEQLNPLDRLLGINVGDSVLFHTVSNHFVGRLVDYNNKYYLIEQPSWVADSGRFSDSLEKGLSDTLQSCEVEHIKNPMLVKADAVVAVFPYIHTLPDKSW